MYTHMANIEKRRLRVGFLQKAFRYLIVGAFVAIVLIGCPMHDSVGIFFGIATEQFIADSNLGGNFIMRGMVSVVVDNETYLYAIAKRLNKRENSSRGWFPINHPNAFANGQTNDIACIPTDCSDSSGIYVAFSDENATRHGLYRLDATDDSWRGNLYDDTQIVRLLAINDNLFIVTRNSDSRSFRLSRYNPDNNTLIPINPRETPEIIDGAYVASAENSHYIFISRSIVYRLNSLDGSGLQFNEAAPIRSYISSSSVGSVDSLTLSGVLVVVDDDRVERYISAREGYLFYSDGGSWIASPQVENTQFTDLAAVGDVIVVGVIRGRSGEGGYRQFSVNKTASPQVFGSIQTPEGNYSSTQMSEVTVAEFFTSNNNLFALTYGRGLWRASYSMPDDLQRAPEWSWE